MNRHQMVSKFQYIRADSLRHALDWLAAQGADTSVIAGGTDLMISIRKGDLHSRFVLDISRLEELRAIELRNGLLEIGSAVTFSDIVNSPLVRECAPALVKAAKCVGSVQIRNVGTIGGNVANASPAADGVPPLVVHNAVAIVNSAAGQRRIPVHELITGPYVTALRPDELLTKFLLEPIGNGYRSGFQRIARRRALAVARINAAAVTYVGSDGAVRDLRLCLGSITPTPYRMKAAEDHLLGKRPDLELIRHVAKIVSQEMIRQSGIRPSTEYKEPAVQGLVVKVLSELLLE